MIYHDKLELRKTYGLAESGLAPAMISSIIVPVGAYALAVHE